MYVLQPLDMCTELYIYVVGLPHGDTPARDRTYNAR